MSDSECVTGHVCQSVHWLTLEPSKQQRLLTNQEDLQVKLSLCKALKFKGFLFISGIAMPSQGAMIHAVGPGGQTITVQSEAVLQNINKILSASGSSTPTTITMTTGASPTTTIATGQQILTVTTAAGKGQGQKTGGTDMTNEAAK